MRYLRHLKLFAVMIATALSILGLAPAAASSANISHSYRSTSNVKNGSLVSLDSQKTDYVVPSNVGNGQRLLGIAVASDDSLLAVDPTVGSVQVATSGTANAIVSTINGDISVGDQVAVSPFDGVGMKAAAGSKVVGLAQTSFNSSTPGSTDQLVTDKKGKTSQIKLGFARIGIAPGTAATANDSQITGLQKLAKNLSGHTVSTLRLIISLIVAIVGLASIITLVYASIYSSIISIGRNPLAKYAVFRSLTSVLAMAGLVALVTGTTVFLLLH